MENIEYNAYVKDTLSFVRGIVIKFEEIATVDNNLLAKQGYPISSDKRTWRYYLNLSGEYHPNDEIMYVKSLDTDEQIVFNKANLAIHLATQRSYASGDYLYNQLVEKYSAQRDLIRGILNPIDLDTAINANNYRILSYDDSYIEENEDRLIRDLQKWVNSITFQHFGNEYFYTDDLMLPASIMVLYGLMTPAIMTIREEAVGTRHVHSFHVWSRINSYGDFQPYKNILTKEQSLWLYRNIDWITKNAGNVYTFTQLIENLLTARSVPLAEFRLMLSSEAQLSDLTPAPIFKRNPLNLEKEQTVAETYYSPERVNLMESDLALDNPDNQSYYLDELKENGKAGLYSDTPIKLLESSMEDYTNRHDLTLMVLLRDSWGYLATNKKYNAIIEVTSSVNGNQYRFTMLEALIVWNYLTMSARGEDTTYIPPFYYRHVAKLNPPKSSDLLPLGDSRHLTKEICDTIAGLKTTFPTMISSDVFYNKIKEVYGLYWKHKKFFSKFGDLYQRMYVRNACSAMYQDGLLKLTETTKYEDWFVEKDIQLGSMTVDELQNMAWDIFQKATGFDVYGTDSLRYTQSMLIELMMKLSSYTVHTFTEIDDGFVTIEKGNRTDIAKDYDNSLLIPGEQYFFLPLETTVYPSFGLQHEFPVTKETIVGQSMLATLKHSYTLPLKTTLELTNSAQMNSLFISRATKLSVSQ